MHRRWLVVSSGIAAVVAAAVLIYVRRDAVSSRSSAAKETARELGGASSHRSAPLLAQPESDSTATGDTPALAVGDGAVATSRGITRGAPGTLDRVPERYELVSMRGVPVVRLAGGPPLEGPRGSSTPERTRVVRGRVIDRAGQPVEGAVVMIDQQFYVMDGNLMAKAGATTDAKGEFVVPNVPVIDRSWARPHAIALHPTGWSAVTAAAGDTLELRIIGRGGLRGKARYGARPESFTLEIYSKLPGERTVRLFEPDIDLAIETFTGRFGVYYETYPDGRYEIASLPPGDYTVRFMLAVNTDGSAPRTFDREVSIVDGQTTILDVDQERAGVVVLDIAIPQPPDIMECWLFEGSVTPTVDTVATLAKRSGVRSRYGTETPVQFYDVAPGIYTACALARNYNREPWFGCSPVFIGSADDVREVELKLVATSM